MPERTATLVAGEGFVLPALDSVIRGAPRTAPEERLLFDTYFDSADLRLARWGCALRHREGEGWMAVIPVASSGRALGREEVPVCSDLTEPPAEALALVSALVRDAAVVPVAWCRTRQIAYEWQTPGGATVLTLADGDARFETTAGGAVALRELVVTLTPDADESLLERVAARLVAAGARVERPLTGLSRALGERAAAPPDVVEPSLSAHPTAREVIHAAIARSVTHLVLHLPAARIGLDPEGVHQARVATRRLRSDLRTFGTLLDPIWAGGLQESLRVLAEDLGKVRDADVLLALLRDTVPRCEGIDRDAAGRVLRVLEDERALARTALIECLDNARTAELLDELVDAASDPRTAPQADDPAAERLAWLVRRRWSRLHRAAEALGPGPAAEQLHEIRILAKRTRYAAEAVAPAFGDDARAFARAVAGIQDVLGDFNDATVARSWLTRVLDWVDTPAAFAAGHLAQVLTMEGLRRLPEWEQAYRKASRKELCSWFR